MWTDLKSPVWTDEVQSGRKTQCCLDVFYQSNEFDFLTREFNLAWIRQFRTANPRIALFVYGGVASINTFDTSSQLISLTLKKGSAKAKIASIEFSHGSSVSQYP